MDEIQTHGYQLASKGKRLMASFVEGMIFFLLVLGIYLLLGESFSAYWNADFEFVDIGYSAIEGLVVGAIFYPIFTGNLGHRIFQLKVVSSETGEDYRCAEKGAIRECLKYVLAFLLIPVIWILWDEKNQNLYDKLTKTLVVEKDKVE